MVTIELHGPKSVVSFDLDLADPPRTAFIEYQGGLYFTEDANRISWKFLEGPRPVTPADGLMNRYYRISWKFLEGPRPAGESVTILHDDCSVEVPAVEPSPVVEPQPEPAPAEPPAPTPEPQDAPHQPEAV